MIELLLSILLLPLAILFDVSLSIKQEIEARKAIKEWHENSFEFEGGRYSKDYYVLLNGKYLIERLGQK